jgi:ADP-ribosylation factor-binding protein GGA
MEPQTGRRLQPYEGNGIRQTIYLNGVEYGKGNDVKLRWKASYKIGAEAKNEAGEISTLGVA